MRKFLPLVLVAAGAIALFAWNVADRPDADVRTGTPLDFVPADTPYLLAFAEPLPRETAQQWLRQLDPLVPVYVSQMRRAAAMLREAGDSSATLPSLLDALAAELEGKRIAEVLAAAGLGTSPRSALYGLGLVPVLRAELEDPDAFRAFVARMEAATGTALATASVGTQSYWRMPLPESRMELLAAVVGRQLVVAPAPAAAPVELLEALLGITPPEHPLGSAETLEELRERFDYLPYLLGYLDTGRLLVALTGEPGVLEQPFLAALGIDKPATDPICADEYRTLATLWPRLSMGYTIIDPELLRARMVMEAAPRIAEDLMALRAPMPALGAVDRQTLANVGFSLDLAAVPRLVNKHASALGEAPYACPQLAWINEGAAQARTGLSNPALFAASPVFRGFHLVLEDLVLAPPMQLQSLRGALVVGSPDPRMLLAMAGSVLPQATTLQLQPDGRVAALELPAVPGVPAMPAFAAMTDRLLAIGVGSGIDARLPQYLASSDDAQPLLVFGYSGRLYAMLADIIEQGAQAMPAGPQREEMQQQATMMREVYGDWIERAELRVEFTEAGIELLQDAHTRPTP